MSDEPFQRRLANLRSVVDARLAVLAPSPGRAPEPLAEAVRYALLSPAKRLRPLLALLAAEHFGPSTSVGLDPAREAAALDAGCAVEMVHAASLILDDLPCMDDAAVRRGRPACHLRFGEDVTILAAVALLNQAYATIAMSELPAEARLALVTRLSEAIGFDGLVAGQARDLRERDAADPGLLHELNRQKTGVLFVAAVEAGAIAAGAGGERLAAARAFAARLGEAFQILDDLLDATSTSESAGKDVRQDARGDRAKSTVVSLVGLDAARAEMRGRLEQALAHLADTRQGPHAAPHSGPLVRFSRLVFGPTLAAA